MVIWAVGPEEGEIKPGKRSLSTSLVADCLDCNRRLVCPFTEEEISFLMAKSGFRLDKRNAIYMSLPL